MAEANSLDVDLSELLSSLDDSAKKLNKISNNANEVIKSLNNRLLRANIGMEVWWDDGIMDADSSSELGEGELGSWARRLLGFARVHDEWCLAVKTIRYVRGYVDGDPNLSYTTEHLLEGPSALQRAPRDVRLAALKKMPEFLRFLRVAVDTTVNELESTTQSLLSKKK